jgi:hypothetical protein
MLQLREQLGQNEKGNVSDTQEGEVSSGNQLTCQLIAQQSAGTGICSSSGNSLVKMI